MKVTTTLLLVCILALGFFGCDKSENELKKGIDLSVNNQSAMYSSEMGSQNKSTSRTQVFNGLSYRFEIVDAIEFIEQSGQKVDKEDEADLSNESVGILDISCQHDKTIFDLLKDRTKEEGIAYLMLDIVNDLDVSQRNNAIEIFSNSYDVNALKKNSIRVYFFMDKVQKSDSYSVE